MNIKKYKSVVLPLETYEVIVAMTKETDRSISKTLQRLVENLCVFEAGEALLDCELLDGGTPRIKRMVGDILWLKNNSDSALQKKFIIDGEEQETLNEALVLLKDLS